MQTDAELAALYRDVVMDHARRPRAGDAPPCPPGVREERDNPVCGDRVAVALHVDPAASDTVRVGVVATGCAVCVASGSILTEVLGGRGLGEAVALVAGFRAMIADGAPDPALGVAQVLAAVAAFPARRRCATLAWEAADAALARSAR